MVVQCIQTLHVIVTGLHQKRRGIIPGLLSAQKNPILGLRITCPDAEQALTSIQSRSRSRLLFFCLFCFCFLFVLFSLFVCFCLFVC